MLRPVAEFIDAYRIWHKVTFQRGRILTTQLYFPGDPANKRDGLYRQELEVKKLKGDEAGFDFVV